MSRLWAHLVYALALAFDSPQGARRPVDSPCIGARHWNGIGTIHIVAEYHREETR